MRKAGAVFFGGREITRGNLPRAKSTRSIIETRSTNLKQAALLKIMLRVLVLIMQHASIMLRVDLARVRLPLIISLPPKKTAPVFLTQLVCIIFLSAFCDIMQTENNGFG